MRLALPTWNLTATTVRGLATCSLPPKPYHRIITNVKVTNTIEGEVFVYVGSLDDSFTARHFVGSNNTLRGEIDLPAGQGFWVVWANAPNPVALAQARVSCDKSDGEVGSLSLTWDAVEEQRSLLAPDLISQSSPNQLIATTQSIASGILDMRAYQSYIVRAQAYVSGVSTVYGNISVDLQWYADLNISDAIYSEQIRFLPYQPLAAFNVMQTDVFIQDAVHGAYLYVTLRNNGADSVTVELDVFGNSRALGGMYIRQDDFNPQMNQRDNGQPLLVIGATIAAGVTVQYALRLAPGPAHCRWTNGATAATFQLVIPDNRTIALVNLAAAGVTNFDVPLPRHQCRFAFTNNGAANNTFVSQILTHQNYW